MLFYLAECRRHEATIEELRSTIDSLRRRHEATIEELSSTVEGLKLRVQQQLLETREIMERANRRRQRAIRRHLREATGYRLSRAQVRQYRLLVRQGEAAASQGS